MYQNLNLDDQARSPGIDLNQPQSGPLRSQLQQEDAEEIMLDEIRLPGANNQENSLQQRIAHLERKIDQYFLWLKASIISLPIYLITFDWWKFNDIKQIETLVYWDIWLYSLILAVVVLRGIKMRDIRLVRVSFIMLIVINILLALWGLGRSRYSNGIFKLWDILFLMLPKTSFFLILSYANYKLMNMTKGVMAERETIGY